jgi:DNA-binding MarR family transcriptional regulator
MSAARQPFDRLAALDKTIHEPARLAILTVLSACRSAEFRYLLSITGLTPGNLSMHLTKLEQKDLIAIEKGFAGKYPATSVHLTDTGRDAIGQHWRQLRDLEQAAKHLKRRAPIAAALRSLSGTRPPDTRR